MQRYLKARLRAEPRLAGESRITPMTMTRRSVLQSLLVAPSAVMALQQRALSAGASRPLMLVCDGIGPDMEAQTLEAFLTPFRERKLKLAVSISPDKASSIAGSMCRPVEEPNVEWVAETSDLSPDIAYFQMRAASEVQKRFIALRSSCAEQSGRSGSLTLSCRAAKRPESGFDGVRAAGFRNVLLRPDEDAPFEHWTTDNGVLQFQGGVRLDFANLDRAITAMFEDEEDAEPLLVYMSLKDLPRLAGPEIEAMARSFTDILASRVLSGDLAPTLPSDFHLSAAKPSRFIGLHFDLAQGKGIPEVSAAAMAAAGIVFSYSGISAAIQVPAGSKAVTAGDPVACPVLGNDREGAGWSELKAALAEDLRAGSGRFAAPQICAVQTGDGSVPDRIVGGTGIAVVTSSTEGPADIEGLDNEGLFHMPASIITSAGDTKFDPAVVAGNLRRDRDALRDILIVVRPEPDREALNGAFLGMLQGLAQDRSNVFVGLPGIASGILPADPIFDLLKRARAQDFIDGDPVGTLESKEKAELEKDAETAWRYFERLSDPRSGLAISTAELSNGKADTYPVVTMWDVGSQILATTSARSIGLIGDGEFSRRIASLLKSLPATNIRGMALPQSQISAVQPSYRDSDFNASDTGRLLLALKILEKRFGMDKEVSGIVGRWNLDRIILDRRLQNVEKGRFNEYFGSNYVEYGARSYGLWGLETENPYEAALKATGTDRDMRLLYRASELGPISTEPHVLEEIEIGYSEASRLIAKVLYAAQVSAYEASGRFYCISEISIGREPWFLYPGFELGAERDPWIIETLSADPQNASSAFRASSGVVSTKGAFMWAAVRPAPYSRKLLALVREKARIRDFGFASAIPMQADEPVDAYSDSNTNGIILEAIAYVLRGRRPLLASD